MMDRLNKQLLLAIFLLLSSQWSIADSIANLKQFFADTQTMQANFKQVVFDQSGAKVQEVNGNMQLKRPNMFRWDYDKPYEQQIVSDGHDVFLYDIDLEQVTVRAINQALGSTPAALLAGGNAIEEGFVLKNAASKDGLDWVLVLPKNKDSGYERILLGFKADQLLKMELYDSFSHVTHITFDAIKQNPVIENTAFLFTPPEHVDVVGD